MAGTVVSAVVEVVLAAVVGEIVGGISSYMVGKHKDMASKRHNVEKLEIAHTELELALERSKNLPITDVSLLRKRKIIECAFEECGHVLHKYKQQALEDEENEQAVTRPSFPKRIGSLISSLGKGVLGCSDVGRFQRLADVSREFRIELESGCSLRQYMFIRPLVRPLLEGKSLWYKTVQGSRSRLFGIVPVCSEGHGAEAWLYFGSKDLKMPTNRRFFLCLGLRLSESTNMVGIAIDCLESLGLPLKSVAQFAMGELAQLPAQDVLHSGLAPGSNMWQWENGLRNFRPDPLCCRANAHSSPRTNNSISSSEISYRFPEQVIYMGFRCYNMQISSSHRAVGKAVVRNWAPLELTAIFAPHFSCEGMGMGKTLAWERISGENVPINGSLRDLEEMVPTNAVDYFIEQPVMMEYWMCWLSAHGVAGFLVEKPITKSKGRSKTRRKLADRNNTAPAATRTEPHHFGRVYEQLVRRGVSKLGGDQSIDSPQMVGSALAQETLGRAVPFILSKHEEKASRADYIERLEMACSGLGSALEISNKVPIIDPSLLARRKIFKRAYEECSKLLDRSKRRVVEDEESSEQGVTAGSSLASRAFHAVKSFVSSSVSQKNDELNKSNVKRFEWYEEEASKFVRDVASGCSLAYYRFISTLVRPLLEGIKLSVT